jgi:putative salt-induced outer membrane protein YdiY
MALAPLCSGAADAAAATTNTPPPWETSAAAGLTLTRGNSDTLLITLGLDTKRKWDKNEAAFGVQGAYGENDSVKNNQFVNAFGQYNRMFTDRFYAGLRLDFNYDGIALLDYRFTISPLAGYYLIKEKDTTFSVEAGPSGVFEKYRDRGENDYLGFRLAERFDHKLSHTTKIWEAASYVPDVEKWTEKYIITAEAGIDTAITKHWSLRVVVQDIYDSQPAPGRKNNDVRLIAGTAYKF